MPVWRPERTASEAVHKIAEICGRAVEKVIEPAKAEGHGQGLVLEGEKRGSFEV